MLQTFKDVASRVAWEVRFYRLILKDPRTPRLAKLCLAVGLGYLVFPFDLIPDFLPGIGHLDDIVIVGGMVWIALKLIPQDVLNAHRAQSERN